MYSKDSLREIILTRAVLILSTLLSLYWVVLMLQSITAVWPENKFTAIESTVFLCIGISLLYGSTVFILTRIGRLKRIRSVKNLTEAEIALTMYDGRTSPTLTILVPSYREELRTVEMTLLSAASLEYPHKRVILLVDDPVASKGSEDRLLADTLSLPARLNERFAKLREHVRLAEERFRSRQGGGTFDAREEFGAVADVFEYLRMELWQFRESFKVRDHTDHFFASLVLDGGMSRLEQLRDESLLLQYGQSDDPEGVIERYYARARAHCSVELFSFQRRKYENVSHEPNKAMNLNSYIGLMGGRYREEHKDGTCHIVSDAGGDIHIPTSDYIITLDANSLLSHDYALRLVQFLEQPENARIAVAQTPYNTFRSPFVDIERIAGATTDIQHLIHQGFEYFRASFWVGANALIRYRALEDIKETDTEGVYDHKIYPGQNRH